MTAFVKAMLAASLLPALASTALPLDPPTVGDNHPMVAKVSCLTGWGSAFRVGKNYWLSVSHVTDNGHCMVNGEPISDLWTDPKRDFSIFRLTPGTGKSLGIDCAGFIPGRKYVAIGHARGMKEQTRITMTATGQTYGSIAELRGVFTVIPGMSGGPVIDKATGKVVGTINLYNPRGTESGSVELRGTSVCNA